MATVKSVSAQEQNTNMIAGVQFDTAVYGTAAPPVLRVGRDAPVYVVAGVQTSVTAIVVLDTANAYHGAQQIVKRGTAVSTSVIDVRSGSAAGVSVGQITSSAQDEVVAVFDGPAQVWR